MSAIIFDFDGTIADSFQTFVRIFHDITGRQDHLTPQEIERMRGMSLHKAAEELKIRPWTMPFLVVRGRRLMSRQIKHIKAHPGMPELIRHLYNQGHQLFIMSSNSEKNIQLFLKQHHMSKEFIKIYGSVGLLSKAGVLRRVRRQNRLGNDTCWYIGDEVRDIEGAKLAGMKVMAVSWGFNTPELLREHQPTVMVNSPAELLAALEEI